jgi:hypothetical protein
VEVVPQVPAARRRNISVQHGREAQARFQYAADNEPWLSVTVKWGDIEP